jgi:hypothetical protein
MSDVLLWTEGIQAGQSVLPLAPSGAFSALAWWILKLAILRLGDFCLEQMIELGECIVEEEGCRTADDNGRPSELLYSPQPDTTKS